MEDHHRDELMAVLRRIEVAADERGYLRGRADAANEIQQHLASFAAEPAPTNVARIIAPASRVSGTGGPVERKRAPKGLVPKFVRRVLESVNHGLSPQEMRAYAENNDERMIKPASIRGELSAGKKLGRYRDHNGKWFLVRENLEAEDETVEGQPSASLSAQGREAVPGGGT